MALCQGKNPFPRGTLGGITHPRISLAPGRGHPNFWGRSKAWSAHHLTDSFPPGPRELFPLADTLGNSSSSSSYSGNTP
ncbi:hypothetical protein Trco_003352 [Trichoderma cornu-damae]|uniref:Uncharacterized protein n=1 Tax=Trichoderma cornu-damae TaxID=654480 RepID=A0A9P8TVX4_9HYPO|nr:hypothetical protein Trco_003352 [Trichoderma cornu-damae]